MRFGEKIGENYTKKREQSKTWMNMKIWKNTEKNVDFEDPRVPNSEYATIDCCL